VEWLIPIQYFNLKKSDYSWWKPRKIQQAMAD